MRLDHVAVFIFDEGEIALIVRRAQQLARRRAYANGENMHASIGRLFGRRERFSVRIVVFTVGEKDQHFMIVLAFLERPQSGSNSGGKRGAALRNDARYSGRQLPGERPGHRG